MSLAALFEQDELCPDLRWTIDFLQVRLQQRTFQVKSPPFQWKDYPVLARAKLTVTEDGNVHLWMDLEHLLRGESLQFKYIPTVFYIIREVASAGSEKKDIVRASSYVLGTVIPYRNMYHEVLFNRSKLDSDEVDSLTIDIVVESPSLADRAQSYDGCVDLEVPHYRQQRRVEEAGLLQCVETPYFYTGGLGYRVRVNFYLAGFGANVLGVAVCFLPGVFDGLLPLDFPHQTKVFVYNRKRPERCITKTVERNIDKQSVYCIEVCSNEKIEELIGSDDDLSFYVKITHLSEAVRE